MIPHTALRIIHLAASSIAILLILAFLTSTVASELSGDVRIIADVKSRIVFGLLILVPALALSGGTGFALARGRPRGLAAVKLQRMKFVAANGLLVLVPSALYLHWWASQGEFGLAFAVVQGVELVAGALNLSLLGLNMRDGLRLAGRLAAAPRRANGRPASQGTDEPSSPHAH